MDRRVIVLIVIVAIAAAVGLLYVGLKKDGEEPPINVENVGGKYNATISLWEGYGQIEYTDEEGKHSEMYFKVEMKNGLDWIRTDTPENATFLCWWDYGHMIKGYGERNVVARNPSEETKECVADPSSITEFDPHERVSDVAIALTTNNFTEMLRIMEKYAVTHILVCEDDLLKASWMYRIAGLEWTEYLIHEDSETAFTDVGMQTMIAKLLENRDTGFTLIYEDEEIKVYKVHAPTAQDLIFEVSVDKSIYQVNETILIELNITNPTDFDIHLNFSSSRQFDYTINSTQEQVYCWSGGKVFLMWLTSIEIEAHDSYIRIFHHTAEDYPLEPGNYVIEGFVVGYFTDSTEIKIG